MDRKVNNKLNIGIVTTWFERGAAYVSRAYMKTLANKHDVWIYVRGGEEYAQGNSDWDDVNIWWGKRRRIGVPQYIDWGDFQDWIRQHHIDVIIFNEQQSWDVILRCRNENFLIGSYVDYYTARTVPFFQLYDFLLCNTQRHFDVFKDHLQALYIPWGTDCDLFKSCGKSESQSYVTFFHSCGVSPYRKGTDLLIRAFQEIHHDARLIIHTQSPINIPDINDLIKKDDRIEVIEEVVGAPGLYHLGDVYVYPTRLEGIGLTIAEAAASGLPVITTDNAPMNEFVKHGVNGRLVAVNYYKDREDGYYWPEGICSIKDLAANMQFYIDHQHELVKLKATARQFAESNLNWKLNSASLPYQLSELNSISKPSRLYWSAAKYEYLRYPKLMWSAFVRKSRAYSKKK